MKNTLGDLNNYLFAQLERLDDDSLSEDDLKKEISRTKAMSSIAAQVISNGNLVLKSKMAYEETFDADKAKPPMLEG